MAHVSNPFDLLSALDKQKSSTAVGAAQRNGAHGDAPRGSQKKRRSKSQKNKLLREERQEADGQDGEVTSTVQGEEVDHSAAPQCEGDSTERSDPALFTVAGDGTAPLEETLLVAGTVEMHSAGQLAAAILPGTEASVAAAEASRRLMAEGGSLPAVLNSGGSRSAGTALARAPERAAVFPADVAAQMSDLETAARQSSVWAPQPRAQLWRQWTLQAKSQPPAESGLSWKELFLSSSALECLLDGALDSPLDPGLLPELQALLSALLPSQEAALSLAQVTVDLSQLLACSATVDPQLLKSTKDALRAAVACLKRHSSGWAVRRIASSLQDQAVLEALMELNGEAMRVESHLSPSDQSCAGTDTGPPAAAAASSSSADKTSSFKELAMIGEKRLSTILEAISPAQPSDPQRDSADSAADMAAHVAALDGLRSLTSLILQRKREGILKLSTVPPPPATVPWASTPTAGNRVEGAGANEQNALTVDNEARVRRQGVMARAGESKASVEGVAAGVSGLWLNGEVKDGNDDAGVEQELAQSVDDAARHLQTLKNQVLEAEAEVARLKEASALAEHKHRELQQQHWALKEKMASQAQPQSIEHMPSARATAPAKGAAVTTLQSEGNTVSEQSRLAGSALEQELDGPAGSSPAERHQLQCSRQLGAVHALETLLLRQPIPSEVSGEPAPYALQEAVVWPAVAHAVTEHLKALASLLQCLHGQLLSVGQRLRFCREKIRTIKVDIRTYRAMGRAQMVDSLAKPLESAEGLHAARLLELDAVVREADAVEAALHHPDLRSAVALLPVLPPVHLLLQQIGTLLHQMRQEHAQMVVFAPADADQKEPRGAPGSSMLTPVAGAGEGAASAQAHLRAGHGNGVHGKRNGDVPTRTYGRGRGKKAIGEGRPQTGVHSAEFKAQEVKGILPSPTKTAWHKAGEHAPAHSVAD